MTKYILIICLFPIISCGTVHKLFDHKKEKIDSTAAMKSDTAQVSHFDTSSVHESFEMHGSDIEVQLEDSVGESDTTVIFKTGNEPIQEYVISYDPATHTISSNQKIKAVHYHFWDDFAMNDSTGMIRDDSSVKHVESTVVLKKDVNEKVKTVEKKGVQFGTKAVFFIGLILAILILFIVLYIRKKKKTISDVIHTAKDIL